MKTFKEKVNKSLLKQMYAMDSPSGKEDNFKSFLFRFVKRNFGVTPKYDKKGNMYITKGNPKNGLYPCVIAHCDEVSTHAPRGKDFRVLESDGKIFGMSMDSVRRHGLGADDKNGIWVALNMLELFENIKVAFFVEEEIGDRGSHEADMTFFSDVMFVIEPDRKGCSDFIINAAGRQVATKEFADKLPLKEFGYKIVDGGLTDIVALRGKGLEVCSCNLSCGYYNPHTETEYTDFAQLENCMRLVEKIIFLLQEKQEFKVPEPQMTSVAESIKKEYKSPSNFFFDMEDDAPDPYFFDDPDNVAIELEPYFDGCCPETIEETWQAVEQDYEGDISREMFEYAYDDYCLYNGYAPFFNTEEFLFAEDE